MLLPQMELFKDSDIINVVLVLFFSQEISSFKQISNHYLIRNQNWIFQVTKHTIYIRHSGRHLTPQSTFHFNLIRMNTIDHQQITSKTLRSCFLICHTPVDQDIDTTMTALIVAKWTRYSSATMMEARFPFFFHAKQILYHISELLKAPHGLDACLQRWGYAYKLCVSTSQTPNRCNEQYSFTLSNGYLLFPDLSIPRKVQERPGKSN